ncbi:MAG: IS21-like element helper ATPase IstB [Bacteroidota bacterium]
MNQQTLEKLSQMRLHGMKEAFETLLETKQTPTLDQGIAMLTEAEWEYRQTRKMERYVKSASFRYCAAIEELDYSAGRNLNKNQVLRLAQCTYIERGESVLITGPTGTGKSFLASALGHQGCLKGYQTLYSNLQKLFIKLRMGKADHTYHKQLRAIEKTDLLILDDFGLQVLDHEMRMILLGIIEDRHSRKATIIVSQLPVKNWYDVINEATIAEAILDRIVHNSNRIELKGESLRKRAKK